MKQLWFITLFCFDIGVNNDDGVYDFVNWYSSIVHIYWTLLWGHGAVWNHLLLRLAFLSIWIKLGTVQEYCNVRMIWWGIKAYFVKTPGYKKIFHHVCIRNMIEYFLFKECVSVSVVLYFILSKLTYLKQHCFLGGCSRKSLLFSARQFAIHFSGPVNG